MIEILRNAFWGIFMALGELLPGVGMQTVAIIAGLYDDLINFLFQGTEFLKTLALFIVAKAKKDELYASFIAIPWKFGIPVFIALAATIVVFSRVVGTLFDMYPNQIAAISFGIVLASVAIPFREMTEKRWQEFLLFAASFAAFFGLFSIQTTELGDSPAIWLFFGGGLLASIAGFFPGISISFALLLMGLYRPLYLSIEHITSRNADLYSFLAVVLFLVGLGIGMLVCVRLLAVLIEKYKSLFLAFIMGLILASLRAIWPFLATDGTLLPPWQVPLPQFTQQIIAITVAFVLVSVLRKLAENKGTLASSFGRKERTVVTD